MLSRRTLLSSASILAMAPGIGALPAVAQRNWPASPIHIVCGVPAGSGADIVVRFYAKKLQDISKATVIVDNKPGANGNIATQSVVQSKPDGYTIYVSPASAVLAAAPSLFSKLPFDPINDLEHITTLAKAPFLLVVSADSPYMTTADLVRAMKERGDKASHATVNNTGIIAGELLKKQFDLQTVEVKYRGAPQAFNELWSGAVSFMYVDPAASLSQIKAGRLRVLATTAATRTAALADVPSSREVGIMNTDLVSWWSVQAPKGTPKEITTLYEQWFNSFANDDELKTFLKEIGTDPFPGNSTSLVQLLRAETDAWREYVKLARIEVQ